MPISARNKLRGKIEEIQPGDTVTAVVKATEVMIQKD
jgi:molybdopterin-binding protein